jgi:predicted dehydrogenase
MRVLIVGCGGIAPFHLEPLSRDLRAKIVALCDPIADHREQVRLRFAPDAIVGDDLVSVIERSEPDAAVVLSPTQRHFEHVSQLLERGIPTLCEKPLAESRARIAGLVELSRTGGVPLAIAYQRRTFSTYRTLRREVLSGRWGRVRSVTSLSFERWIQVYGKTWRDDPAYNPGGFVGDAGSHKVDMLFFTTGLSPRQVTAHSQRRGHGVDVVTNAVGVLGEDASLAMVSVGDASHYREELTIHLDEADFLIRDGKLLLARNNRIEEVRGIGTGEATPTTWAGAGSPHARDRVADGNDSMVPLVLEPESCPTIAFLDHLLAGAPNVAPAEIALPVWDFTAALMRSAREGRTVEVIPAESM